jgi:pyruvate,water dikinase
VAIVAEGFARQALHGCTSLPRVRVFCYGNEVHYFVYFRNHPLFVRMDLSPPLGGGMIDLAYYGVSKFELDEHPGLALEAVQAFFRRLDFDIKIENTRIVARYDKERARDLADLCERAEALFRLVPYLMDLDWTVGGLALPDEARRAVGVAWAEFFDQWGIPPAQYALTEDRTGILLAREPRPEGASEVRWDGQGAYSDITTGKPRPGFFTSLRDALATCGLEAPLVEPRKGAGQMSLEAHLLRPLRAALARGELVAGPDGWRRAPPELFRRQHEADRFAEILASDPAVIARSARLAGLAAALERTLRFETTGSVNGFDVQRAELVLRDQRLALYALRDGSGMFRLAVFAPGGAICLRRTDVTRPWTDNASGDVGELTPLLRRSNFLPSWIDAQPVAGSGDAEEIRAIFRSPNPRARESSLPGERALTAERASPGRAVGPARLGTRRRHPDDLDGAVLFSASLKPEDSVFLYRAAAVVATGGGALSHAGLLAVQFGRPALIAPGTWREEPDGSVLLVCRRREFGERRRTVCGFAVVERCDVRDYDERIREGDLVVVDADEGVLTVLGQSNPALALHDGLRQLVAATRRLEQATSATEVLADRGRRLHALHQLERLACRMEDPALTQHAVRELLTGTAAAEGLHGETSRLLGLLRGRAETRGLVETCIERIARDVAERHAAARDRALRLLPSSRYAFEALALRLDVVRVRQTLEQAREVLRAASVPQPGDLDIAVEELAGARLGAILDTLLDRLRQPVALAVSLTARHELREAERIAGVIGAPEDVAAQLRSRRSQCAQRDAELARALEGRPVLWPEDGGLEIEPLAGAKAANLAELQRLGAGPFVPSWFVVTDHAFREALKGTVPRRGGGAAGGGEHVVALGQAIDEVLARSDLDAEEKSAAIRRLWDNVYLPNAVSRAVTDAYRRLSESGTTPGAVRDAGIPGADASLETGDPFVAVRSSAREEDTEVSTGAGQFDTFLYVRGASDVLEYLKRGWSGLWTPRAIHSRAAGATSERGRGGGVIVQRMAWSRVSGVLQTVNAAEQRTREMVINVGLGLGEGVVSGLVAADRVVVSKDQDPSREALRFHYVTADKRERVVFNAHRGTGTIRTGILSHQRLRAALEYVELVELVRAATRLEAAYRYPLDIEFGFEAAQLRIMQVRPVPGALAVWEQTKERYPIRCRVSSKT